MHVNTRYINTIHNVPHVTQVQQQRPELPTVNSPGMCVNTRYINSTIEDVPLVEFIYFVFTHIPSAVVLTLGNKVVLYW